MRTGRVGLERDADWAAKADLKAGSAEFESAEPSFSSVRQATVKADLKVGSAEFEPAEPSFSSVRHRP